MKNYVKDNRSGKISTLVKNKPIDVPVKGRIKLELINAKTGEVDVEAGSENIFMNWPYKNAYNGGIFSAVTMRKKVSSSNAYQSLPSLIGTLRLTTNTLPEHGECPLVLGKQIGWAPLDYTYSGDDKQKGTINTAETRHYWNDEGQYVMSMVCDWPTHASNGTFQSIFITYDEDVNATSNLHSGKLIANLSTMPTAHKSAFTGSSGFDRWVHRYNSELNEIQIIGFHGRSYHADYGRRINIFRFNADTGMFVDYVQLKNADGTPLGAYYYDTDWAGVGEDRSGNINHQHNFKHITSGDYLNVCLDGSKIMRRTYNSEGIYKNDHAEKLLTEIVDANGNALNVKVPSSSYGDKYCAGMKIHDDGTIHLYGHFIPREGVYENVIVILNKDLHVENIVYINNRLYPDWITDLPSSNPWEAQTLNSQCETIARFTTGAGTFSYLITKEGNLRYLSDSSYHVGIIGANFMQTGWSINNGDATLRYQNRFNRISTHTLLASPVTKTQSHTMKVTYEIIVEPINMTDVKSFTDFILEQN